MIGSAKQRKCAGFTLVELLLAAALVTMLLSATVVGLSAMIDGIRGNDASLRAREAGAKTLEYILGQIRRAKELDLLSPTDTAGEYLKLGTLDKADWVNNGWSDTGAIHTFFMVSNGTLYAGASENVAEAQPLMHNVNSVVFRSAKSGNPARFRDVTVEITLTVPDAFGGTRQSSTFSIAGSATARAEE